MVTSGAAPLIVGASGAARPQTRSRQANAIHARSGAPTGRVSTGGRVPGVETRLKPRAESSRPLWGEEPMQTVIFAPNGAKRVATGRTPSLRAFRRGAPMQAPRHKIFNNGFIRANWAVFAVEVYWTGKPGSRGMYELNTSLIGRLNRSLT
jgi:hypothetical protein